MHNIFRMEKCHGFQKLSHDSPGTLFTQSNFYCQQIKKFSIWASESEDAHNRQAGSHHIILSVSGMRRNLPIHRIPVSNLAQNVSIHGFEFQQSLIFEISFYKPLLQGW